MQNTPRVEILEAFENLHRKELDDVLLKLPVLAQTAADAPSRNIL